MSFPPRFRSEVPDDIAEACGWYETRRVGLGKDFLGELQAALSRISDNPRMYAAGYREVRSVRLHRFPYVVHYRFDAETVIVLAVMHGGRDPAAWRGRAQRLS